MGRRNIQAGKRERGGQRTLEATEVLEQEPKSESLYLVRKEQKLSWSCRVGPGDSSWVVTEFMATP